MNLFDQVSTIMSTQLITLSPNDSIAEAGKIFEKNRIHHIPVVLAGELVGIISKSDYLFFKRGFLDNTEDQVLEDVRSQNYQVSYIMTKGLAKVDPTTKINVVIDIFDKNILHAIPVVEHDKLVGMVTTHDIIRGLNKDQQATATY